MDTGTVFLHDETVSSWGNQGVKYYALQFKKENAFKEDVENG